jgi:uracil phosphoribosyltransferase
MLLDHSTSPALRLLVNETRRASLSGPSLARAHRAVGAALGVAASQSLELSEVPLDHVAGPSTGVALSGANAPIIVSMMRAGLFVAEGLWESLPGAALVPMYSLESLADAPIAGRTVFLVDSIINTGRSIREVLEYLASRNVGGVVVVAMTAFETGLNRCIVEFPDATWVVARVSQRSYVGVGQTDTGGRLFGTTGW